MKKRILRVMALLSVVIAVVALAACSVEEKKDLPSTFTADDITFSLEVIEEMDLDEEDFLTEEEILEGKTVLNEGETALALSVQNFSRHPLATVRAEVILPDGVAMRDGSLVKTYPVISAGAASNNILFLSQGESEAAGENTLLWIIISIVVTCVVAAVAVIFILRGKKVGKTAMMLLLVALLVVSVSPMTVSAEDAQQKVELAKTLTIGEKTVTVEAVVTYTVNTAVTADIIEPTVIPREKLTRADLEAALVDTAWNYYLKKGYVQYDSTELNVTGAVGTETPLSKAYGGAWRTNTFSSLQDANEDSILYSVCSDYCWNVYNEALEYPILGNRINAVTIGMFRLAEHPQDMVVMRWYDNGVPQVKNNLWTKYGNTKEDFLTADKAVAFLENWEENLRPCDIIVARGNGGHQHAMMYVGNGQILHCGGGKFDLETFVDKTEPNGAIQYATVQGTFIDGSEQKGYFRVGGGNIKDKNENGAWLIVLRPLDVLTEDDKDDDLGNDKLDLDYKLDVGQLEYELANNTKHPVKTSGYGIPDATWTRMQYPGIGISRTVDIHNHTTAVKGGRLTYEIEITNNSDESYYAAYHTTGRDALYMGQAYVNLPITETIPQNTKLVSVTRGGVANEDGTISWNVNVPLGESLTVRYTVEVTGEIGDRIVNDGGFVGNIPSNSITTIIGGEKISQEAQAKMQQFFEAGATAWNSNDGYKITADPDKELTFAERIYEELVGVELELPGVQELADIFFTQKKLYQPYGLHISHDTPTTRYMFMLNDRDEVAPKNQIYYDMLVEGYYGGIWVYSNDYNDDPRVIELRPDHFEAGDILVNMKLRGSVSGGLEYEDRKVTSWQVLVCLGEGRFASLDYKGKMRGVSDTWAIYPSFGQDLFVMLRPSQAYANLYEELPAFQGPAADLTEEDAMNVYLVEPSNILLNQEAIRRLQKLTDKGVTKEGWTALNLGFVGQVYSAIGLDIFTDGIEESTYASVVKACFEDDTNSSDPLAEIYEHLYKKANAPLDGGEALYEMLMYYGGPIYQNPEPLLSLDQLYPGDAVLLGRRNVSAYQAAVYQGNGKFLVTTQEKEDVTSGSQVKAWYQITINNEDELAEWLAEPINEEVSEHYLYEGYIVVRPSRAFDDINKMVLRDIRTGELTSKEKKILANLDIDTWLEDKRPLAVPKFPVWAYKQAHIDVSRYFTDETSVTKIFYGIFKKVEDYGFVPMAGTDKGYNKYFADMLINDCYGGKQFNVKDRKILAYEDLQVGDILMSAKGDGNGSYIYWVALYQGHNEWMVSETPSSGYGKVSIKRNIIFGTDMSKDWLYYFVLRPERLADGIQSAKPADDRDISEYTLTTKEQAKLSAWTTDKLAQLEAFAANAYGNANVDITKYVDLNVNNTRKELFTNSGLLISGSTKYHKMLVPGYYGGSKNAATAIPTGKTFKPEDFKIGDIFCGFMNDKCCDSWQNVIGIYQGEGKFIVSKVSCEKHAGVYTDIYGKTKKDGSIWASIQDMNDAYMYYYVLRPQRLAGEHLQDLVLSATKLELRTGKQASLTFTVNPDTANIPGTPVWTSSDPSVATVDASGNITAIKEGETTIRVTYADIYADCKVSVFYARDIAESKLTDAEKTALSQYTAEKGGILQTFAKNIYRSAQIDVTDVLTDNVNNTRKVIIKEDGTLNPGVSATHRMLIPGYHGGAMNAQTGEATGKTFTPASFQVGDLFCAFLNKKCGHTTSSWQNIIGLYQGDGKFLVSHNGCADCSKLYTDESGKQLTNGMTSIWSADVKDLNDAFMYYYVLRPERLALRDIAEGVLTTQEMAAISTYIPEKPSSLAVIVDGAYVGAGVDVNKAFTNLGVNDARKQIIAENGTLLSGDTAYHKMLMPGYYGGSKHSTGKTFTPADFKTGDVFAAFLRVKCGHTKSAWQNVIGIYQGGGKFIVTHNGCTECTKIYTDVYGAVLSNGHTSIWADDVAELNDAFMYYFVLRPERLAADAPQGVSFNKTALSLFEGDTDTLTVTPAAAAAGTWTSSNTAVATVDSTGKVKAIAAGTAVISCNYDGYTAICEVEVKKNTRQITEGVLTAGEAEALKTYVPSEPWTAGAFSKEAYLAAGIDLAPVLGTDSFFNMQGKLFDATTGLPLAEGTRDATYYQMLLPGYYGGKRYSANAGVDGKVLTPADLKVGDLFIGAKDAACSVGGQRWVYITGLYIGDGKFMVSEGHTNCPDSCNKTYIDEYGKTGTQIWGNAAAMKSYRYYFVLRPELLASNALKGISIQKTADSVLVGGNTTLSLVKNPTTAAAPLNVKWSSSNTAVATVDNAGKVTGVSRGSVTITVNADGYSANCTITVKLPNREITTGALSAEDALALKAYTGTDCTTFAHLANKAYAAASIDVSKIFSNLGFFDLAEKLFYAKTANPNTSAKDYALKPAADQDATFAKMLLPGYYGGSGISRTFQPSDFKVGDLFFGARPCPIHTSNKWNYISAIYQGDGKFLVFDSRPSSCACEHSVWVENVGGANTVVWGDATAMDAYAHFFVLRPELLAADCLKGVSIQQTALTIVKGSTGNLTLVKNPTTAVEPIEPKWTSSDTAVATVDENGNVKAVAAGTATITFTCDGFSATATVTVPAAARKMTAGALTTGEINALKAYTGSDLTTFADMSKKAYAAAGIDLSTEFGKLGFNDLAEKLFYVKTGTKDYSLKPTSAQDATFAKMLVTGYHGGSKTTVRTFQASDFKVGDLFFGARPCHTTSNKWLYVAAIYQGDGKFLVYEQHPAACTSCANLVTDVAGETGYHPVFGDTTAMSAYTHFFVLRPSNLAN